MMRKEINLPSCINPSFDRYKMIRIKINRKHLNLMTLRFIHNCGSIRKFDSKGKEIK